MDAAKLNSLSKIILFVGVYTFASEVVNQYTTIEGVLHGGIENDSTARYLFATVGIGGETIALFAIPSVILSVTYFLGMRWKPETFWRKRLQLSAVIVCLLLLLALAAESNYYTVTDYNTLHSYHIL